MNAYLNYLLEASIGLCLFLLVYQLLLRKETNFRLNRVFLLIAIIASVTFPLISFTAADSPVPSLGLSVDTAETLQYSSSNEIITEPVQTGMNAWEGLAVLYLVGLLIFITIFILRLRKMFYVLKKSNNYTYNHHRIIELKTNDSPFSFFNFIFIGNTPPLSEKEKQQIVAHEGIHAKLYHSFDIVLLNILGIVFWFNPIIRMYKKIFVQLHEFEADARAVETYDVDEYCSLLAKVALHSADYKLANHFSNSLTVKRIEMMRTLKHQIKSWKVAAAASFLPILFFVVACQDQVEKPAFTTKSDVYPPNVQKALDVLKEKNPETDFIVVPPSGANPKDFKGEHAKHISVVNGETVYEAFAITTIETGKDENGNALKYMILHYPQRYYSAPVEKNANDIVFEETADQINGEPIFFAVEKMAEAPGGLEALKNRLKKNAQYPAASKRTGIEGRVFIKFVVKKDGTLTNFKIMKGINEEIDQEVLRLIKTEAQGWKPASQNGNPVNSQFVLPIEFKL